MQGGILNVHLQYSSTNGGYFTDHWTCIDFADITKACCISHTFVADRHGVQLKDTLSITGFENMVTDYFVSAVGTVPWQYAAVNRID